MTFSLLIFFSITSPRMFTSFLDQFFQFCSFITLPHLWELFHTNISLLPTLPSSVIHLPPSFYSTILFLLSPLFPYHFFFPHSPFPSLNLLVPSWATLTWQKTPSTQCRWPSWSCWAPQHGRTSPTFAISPWPGTTPRLTTTTRRCASLAPTMRRCLTTIIPSSSHWWTAAR